MPKFLDDIIASGGSKVGIGLATPSVALHIKDETNPYQLRLQSTGTESWHIGIGKTSYYDNTLLFQYGGVGDKMALTPTGNLGIGELNPTRKLEIVGTYGRTELDGHFVEFTRASANYLWASASGGDLRFTVNGNAIGSPSMILSTGGNLGIGTTSPSHKLNIVTANDTTALGIDIGTSASFDFSANSTSGYTTSFHMNNTGTYIGSNSAGRALIFQTNNTDRLTIAGTGAATFAGAITSTGAATFASDTNATLTSGRAKIGSYVSDYVYFSHIDYGTSSNYALKQSPTGNTELNAKTGGTVQLSINNSPKLTLVGDKIGIGTASPSSYLDVIGDADVGVIQVSHETNGCYGSILFGTISRLTGDCGVWSFKNTNSNTTQLVINDNSSTFHNDIVIDNHNGSNPTDAGSLYFNESGTTWGTDMYGFRINLEGSSNLLQFQSSPGNSTINTILTLNRDNKTATFGGAVAVGGNITGVHSLTAQGISASSSVTTPTIQLQGDLNVLNKAQTSYLTLADRDTSGSEVVYNLANVGSAAFSGNTLINAQLAVNSTTVNAANKLEVHGQARVNGTMMIGNSSISNTTSTGQLHIKNTGEAIIRLEDSDNSNLAFDVKVNEGEGFVITETIGGEAGGDNNRLVIAESTGDATFSGVVSVPSGKSFRLYNAAGSGWGELTLNETDNKIQFNRGIQPSGDNQADQLLGTASKRWHTVNAGAIVATGEVEAASLDIDSGNWPPSEEIVRFYNGFYDYRIGHHSRQTVGHSFQIYANSTVANINWNSGILKIGTQAASNLEFYTGDTTALTIGTSQQATFAGDVRLPASGKLYLWTGHDANYLRYDLWTASASAGMTIQNSSNAGEIYLRSGNALTLTLDDSQNATFAETITWGGGKGILHYGSDRAILRSSSILEIQTNGASSPTAAITLDNSQNATFAGDVTLSSTAPIFYLDNTTSSTGKKWRLSSAANGKMYITQDGVIDAITLDHTTGNATFSGNIVMAANATVDGRDISGIPTSFAPVNADATSATNVVAALNNNLGTVTIGDGDDNINISGNLTIAGVTTMSGGTVVNTTTNTAIKDTTIFLNAGITGSGAGGSTPANIADIGMIFDRGSHGNVFMGWDESEDEFIFAKTTSEGSDDVNTTTGIVIANEETDFLHVKVGSLESVGAITSGNSAVLTAGTAASSFPSGVQNSNVTSVSGNAGSVTNGVYTTGDQTIAGNKSFSGVTELDGCVVYSMASGQLTTTGFACAGLSSATNGGSALFTFECGGSTNNSYQRIVYNCHNDQGTWNTTKCVDEGGNKFDVVASANGSTITFTFKGRSATQNYSPRVMVKAVGHGIVKTYT